MNHGNYFGIQKTHTHDQNNYTSFGVAAIDGNSLW